MTDTQTQKYKVVLVGAAQVGKTTLMNRFKYGTFDAKYIPTYGAEITDVIVATNKGNIVISIWDKAGAEYHEGLGDGYYIDADLAVVMFDKSNNLSLKYSLAHGKEAYRVTPNVKFLLVGNKCELDSVVSNEDIASVQKILHADYCDLSVKDLINIDGFMSLLLKALTGDESITVSCLYIVRNSLIPPYENAIKAISK